MKHILTLLFLCYSVLGICQSANFRAQGKYYSAKEKYEKEQYVSAIQYILESKKLLGGTNYQLQYLHIVTAYWARDHVQAQKELAKYFDLLDKKIIPKGFSKTVEDLTGDETKELTKLIDKIEEGIDDQKRREEVAKVQQRANEEKKNKLAARNEQARNVSFSIYSNNPDYSYLSGSFDDEDDFEYRLEFNQRGRNQNTLKFNFDFSKYLRNHKSDITTEGSVDAISHSVYIGSKKVSSTQNDGARWMTVEVRNIDPTVDEIDVSIKFKHKFVIRRANVYTRPVTYIDKNEYYDYELKINNISFADLVDQNLPEVRVNSNTGVNQTSVKEWQEKGKNYYDSKNYSEALKWFKKAAKQNDAYAQYAIGYMYSRGLGVTKDQSIAFTYFEKSAIKGSIAGQISLAEAYEFGRGTNSNGELTIQWYKKAASQNSLKAMESLGFYFERMGLGDKKAYSDAFYWYEKAAELGDADSQESLGDLYKRGDGVPNSYEKALYWYEKAALQEHSGAMKDLGEMYWRGQGASQDNSKAEYWLKKALPDDSYGDVATLLGEVYFSTQNYEEALGFFIQAASNKDRFNVKSQHYLAHLYRNGLGVQKDDEKANYWYHKVEDSEYSVNLALTYNLYLHGSDGIPADKDKARYWGEIFCEKAGKTKEECSTLLEVLDE